MNEQKYPAGWNAERVKRLLTYYERISEGGQVAEDEEATRKRPRMPTSKSQNTKHDLK